jgi:hypothetical protein
MHLRQRSILKSIKEDLYRKNQLISIPTGTNFFLTKGSSGISQGFLFRDISLEDEVHKTVMDFGFKTIIERYKASNPLLEFDEWPKHYAVKLHLIDGIISAGHNIFMFFPHALGIHSDKMEDYFGFEFIDIWQKIFSNIIFPCMERVFTHSTQNKMKELILDKLEFIAYFAGVFHEFGHRSGPWRISPKPDHSIKLNKFQAGVLGELATDALLVEKLFDFKAVAIFIFLQRLFWFGRNGFNKNNICANVNDDNDCWIGSYLWNKYKKSGCIRSEDQKYWDVDIDHLPQVFEEITYDINKLAIVLKESNPNNHVLIVNKWMQVNMQYDKKYKYLLYDDFRELLLRCNDITYDPLQS